jgi:hypothetical protein
MINVHAEELHALSDRLNENHDLYVLSQVVLNLRTDSESRQCQSIITLVDRRCSELESEAQSIGERVYAERPRSFADRLEHYWRAWEQYGETGRPPISAESIGGPIDRPASERLSASG